MGNTGVQYGDYPGDWCKTMQNHYYPLGYPPYGYPPFASVNDCGNDSRNDQPGEFASGEPATTMDYTATDHGEFTAGETTTAAADYAATDADAKRLQV